MKRAVQGIMLMLVGGAVVRLSISGSYTNYVKPGMRPFLTVAAALLVALGVYGLLRDELSRPPKSSAATAERNDGHPAPRTAWLLLLPVLTIFLIAPPPLGAYAASHGTVSVPEPGAPLPALHGDPADLDVTDFVVRAVWDDGKTLAGHRVRMTGFVTPGSGGAWYLTRIQISCCAADARPVKVAVLGAPAFAADTWVQVVGTWSPGGGTQRADAIPLLRVQSVRTTVRPANPYD